MKVLVHGRFRYEHDRPRFISVLEAINARFKDVAYTEELVAISGMRPEKVVQAEAITSGSADVFISVGGDGTILESVRKVGDSGIPVLGVNTGRMGFLASTTDEQVDEAFDRLEQKDFIVEQRSLVSALTDHALFGKDNFALNEISVHKTSSSSMLIVHAYLDDQFLNSYWADGLIISTPTGSTGYSLSAGGPIVSPATDNVVITPIAPHNLNVRPLIIGNEGVITLKVNGTDPEFLLSLDSQSKVITPEVEVRVQKAPFTVGLIRFGQNDYFDTLRSKLMWGIDKRN